MTDLDLLELTLDTAEPFYDGTLVPEADSSVYPIALGGRGFIMDNDPQLSIYHRYQRSAINLTNTQQAQSGGDSAQVPPETWRRIIESWVGGAGQANADRTNSQATRFYTSRNVDPFEPWKVSLIHSTSKVLSLAAGRSFLIRVNPVWMVAAVGQTLYWFSALAAPVHTVDHGDTILDLTSDGQNLYVLDDTGNVEQYTAWNAHSSFASGLSITANRTLLRYLKGFLVYASGAELSDISGGTAATIYTHPLAGFTWVDACDGDGAVYLIGGQGDRWQVAAMTPKQDASTFDVPILGAGKIPEGEIAYSIGSYLGYVLVGLNTGWRFGAADTNGNLQLGQLIDTAGPVRCFEGQERFVWYGTTDGADTGLGRADLSTFAGPVTPAYASDLRAESVGTVRAVTTFLDKRAFTIDGDGVYVETDDLASEGWLEQGSINFATSDSKIGSYAQVYTEALHGRVLLEAALDGGGFTQIGAVGTTGAVTMGKAPLQSRFDTVRFKVTLQRDLTDSTLGPVLTRIEVRADPIPGNASEWRVPIILGEDQAYENFREARTVRDDFNFLMNLVQSRGQTTFREGQVVHTVHAVDYIWWAENLTKAGDTFQGRFIVILREIA